MSPDAPNPYQSPLPEAALVNPNTPDLRLVKMLRDFRSQIIAVGALFIILGAIAAAAGVFILQSGQPGSQLIGGFVLVVGLIWFALGVCVCAKQVWALYVALVLSYLSLIGNVVNLNVCGLIMLVIVILQSHRVLGWAKQLQQAGIPLTARPEDIQIPLAM